METRQYIIEEQISFQSLITKIVWAKNSVVKNYKFFIVIVLLSGLIGFFYDLYIYKRPTYTAKLVVNVESGNSSGGGGMSQLGGLASAFGISNMGGGGSASSDVFSGDNFNELVKTKTIYFKALMKYAVIGGKKDLLVNHYISKSGIMEVEWKENEFNKKFRFSPKDPQTFTEQENGIMGAIHDKLSEETTIAYVAPRSSFLAILVSTENEQLSKVWAEIFIETLFEFYKDVTTSKVTQMLRFAEQTAEKYKSALYSNEIALAKFSDQNQQIIFEQGKLSETRLNRNNGYFSSQYLQALANADNLRLALIKESPLYSVVEPIRLPLTLKMSSKTTFMVRGFFIGIILGIVLILLKSTYSDIIKE